MGIGKGTPSRGKRKPVATGTNEGYSGGPCAGPRFSGVLSSCGTGYRPARQNLRGGPVLYPIEEFCASVRPEIPVQPYREHGYGWKRELRERLAAVDLTVLERTIEELRARGYGGPEKI